MNLLPIVKKVAAKSIADELIGIRPDETYEQAYNRHIMEQRNVKINKIRNEIYKKQQGRNYKSKRL